MALRSIPLCTLACVLPLAESARGDHLELLSVSSAGAQGSLAAGFATLSADGRFAAFDSDAPNLVAGDTNLAHDVFLRDRQSGVTTRISVSTTGTEGNGASYCPVISAGGLVVTFSSLANNLVANDANGDFDVFLRNLQTGTTELDSIAIGGGSANGASFLPTCSGDGRYVAFVSDATNLVAGDTNQHDDIFVRDRLAGTTKRIDLGPGGVETNGDSTYPVFSADGQYIVFSSHANNLIAGDTNQQPDVFRYSMATGAIERVSVANTGAQATGGSLDIGIDCVSSDGRFVLFTSSAPNLVAVDDNGADDVFVRDVVAGTTKRVSVGNLGEQSDADSEWAAISADGRYVAFESGASNLVPNDNGAPSDVFVRDTLLGTTVRLSDDLSGGVGDASSFAPSISADGHYVAFFSNSTNLVAGDVNAVGDVFVCSRCFVSSSSIGNGLPGSGGFVPALAGAPGVCLGGSGIAATKGVGGAMAMLFVGAATLTQTHVLGGTFYIDLGAPYVPIPLSLAGAAGVAGAGNFSFSTGDVSALAGTTFYLQLLVADGGAFAGVAMSNAIAVSID